MSDIGAEPIEGYRVFMAAMFDGRFELRSYNEGFPPFTRGRNEALCFNVDTGMYGHSPLAYRNREDGSVAAELIPPQHTKIPDARCQCGYWIYRDVPTLQSKLRGFGLNKGFALSKSFANAVRLAKDGRTKPTPYGDFGAIQEWTLKIPGMCKGWGKVLVGTDGWRTEYAQVSALCAWNSQAANVLEPWAEVYDVPIVLVPEFSANARLVLKTNEFEGYLTGRGPDPTNPKGPREWQLNGDVFVAWDDSVIGRKLNLLWELEENGDGAQKIRVRVAHDPRYGNRVIKNATPAAEEE